MFKLLIADDEFIEIEALKFIIMNSTLPIADIKTASNGRDAIDIATSFLPDILIIDIKMPGINGIEAATKIKALLPHCKIIFSSAYDHFDHAKNALQIGASDFLVKPVSNEILLGTLNKVIHDLKSEIDQQEHIVSIQSKFTLLSNYFEYELINYLLSGKCVESQIKEYFASLNINYQYINCLVFQINSDSISQIQSSLKETVLKKRIIKIIKKELATISISSLANYNQDMVYLLLFSVEDIPTTTIVKILTATYTYLSNNLFVSGRMLLSHGFENLMLIPDTFFKLKHYLLTDTNDFSVLSYQKCLNHPHVSTNSIHLESNLIESILLCNKAKSLALADQFIAQLFDDQLPLATIKHSLYELLIFMHKSIAIKSNEYKSQSNLSSPYTLNQLNNFDTKTEFSSYFYEQILYFINIIERDSVTSDSQMDTVCHYIDENYMQNITLESVATIVGFSSHYLSKVFKAEKGLNFSEYLSCVRINAAKNLLKNTNLPINTISLQVGYNDANYFTRVFKQSEALSPTEYRTALRN
jgi:two-component system response regulator YesN